MGEEVEREGLLWDDDQSWAFPNLGAAQEDCAIKSAEISNSDGQLAAKDKEAPLAKGKKRSSAAAAGESEDHELHIWTERERRKKMRNMFSNLHALLPHIPPKADKSTIVDEAVKYIKKLQQTVEELEKRKQGVHDSSFITQNKVSDVQGPNPVYLGPGPEYPAIFKTWTSPNVILNVSGRDGQFSVCSVRKPGLFTAVCLMIEKNNLEVISAQTSSDRARCMCMIHARANGVSDQFQQAFPIEEIFKHAAAEIMMWIHS